MQSKGETLQELVQSKLPNARVFWDPPPDEFLDKQSCELIAVNLKNPKKKGSIYYKDGYLFSYFEYVGNDFEADMKKMSDDSLTQEWWKLTDPCQIPLETRKEGEWWATMEEIFHLD